MANQTPAPPGLQSPAALAQPLQFPASPSGGTTVTPQLFTNSFEGGTSGSNITTGNSGGTSGNKFDLVNTVAGGTLAYDSTVSAHGGLSCKLATGGTAGSPYVRWDASFQTQGKIWFRLYLNFTSFPAAVQRVFAATQQGGSTSIGIDTAGKVVTRDVNSGTITTSTTAIPLSRWFRLEGFISYSTGAGQMEVKIFLSPDSTAADETNTTAANVNTGGTPVSYRFGHGAGGGLANLAAWWQDDIAVSNTGYIGPVGVSLSVPNVGSATPPGLQSPMSLARPVYFQSSSVQPAPGPPPTAPVLAAGQAAPGLVVEGAGASQAQPGRNPFSRVVSQPPAAPPAVSPTDLILTASEMVSPDTIITPAGASVPASFTGQQPGIIALLPVPPGPTDLILTAQDTAPGLVVEGIGASLAQPGRNPFSRVLTQPPAPPPVPLTDLILIAQDTTPGFGLESAGSSLQAPLSPYSRILLVPGVTAAGGYVTVICDLDDGSGNPPIAGTVTFVQSAVLTAPGTGIFARIPVTAAFTPWAPRPQVRLFATDNPGVTPQPWTWQVTFTGLIALPGSFSLLSANGPVQYLSALTPIA